VTDYPPILRELSEQFEDFHTNRTLRYCAEHIERLEKSLRAIAELPAAEAQKSRKLARDAMCMIG
jgi:hypothetical protein